MVNVAEGTAALTRARQGDADAFGLLVQRHSRAVFRLAYRMTGNEQDAEDVVQESFLKAYRQLGRFESRADFGTWIYRIAANCCVDLLRARDSRRGEHVELADGSSLLAERTPGPERLVHSAEIDQRVRRALGSLTPLERAAFTLRHYEGRSIEEIRSLLGLSATAAKHSVFRAVKKVRSALAPLRASGPEQSRPAGNDPS